MLVFFSKNFTNFEISTPLKIVLAYTFVIYFSIYGLISISMNSVYYHTHLNLNYSSHGYWVSDLFLCLFIWFVVLSYKLDLKFV